ncbi:hypothetical protein PanWU01x14_171880 [Parasponia andersonii]|uniref:Uncharacterized protein n=1 Tax=Parasponia andersonii TaxID=3476 RepID=A0A2P5C994_PARAD|nr:hypothetical protein PanWU01x14_171880 [Parasponia andersonii]
MSISIVPRVPHLRLEFHLKSTMTLLIIHIPFWDTPSRLHHRVLMEFTTHTPQDFHRVFFCVNMEVGLHRVFKNFHHCDITRAHTSSDRSQYLGLCSLHHLLCHRFLIRIQTKFQAERGSVTAGNASLIRKLSLLAREFFTTAPALVIPKAISNAGLDASQIDYEFHTPRARIFCVIDVYHGIMDFN